MIQKAFSRRVFEIFNVVFMICLSIVMLYPFIFVLSASLSGNAYVAAGQVTLLPKGFNLRAYEAVLGY